MGAVKKAFGSTVGQIADPITSSIFAGKPVDPIGGLVKDKLGFNREIGDPRFIDVNAGGLTVTNDGRVIDVSSGADRLQAVGGIRNVLNQRAEEIAGLRERVTPGFGALTDARVGAIDDARRRTVGNLRENLQRRRVLGSSFGQDVLSRAEAEFGKQEGLARAETFLQELDLQTRLIEQEFESRQQAVQATLDNLNLEAQLASNLATGANEILQRNQEAQAELAAAQSQGFGQLLGTGLSAAAIAFSDRRLKTDVVRIGEHNGLPVYEFRYIGSSERSIGHMADEVMKVRPDVVLNVSGYLAVDYGALYG